MAEACVHVRSVACVAEARHGGCSSKDLVSRLCLLRKSLGAQSPYDQQPHVCIVTATPSPSPYILATAVMRASIFNGRSLASRQSRTAVAQSSAAARHGQGHEPHIHRGTRPPRAPGHARPPFVPASHCNQARRGQQGWHRPARTVARCQLHFTMPTHCFESSPRRRRG